jgi:hypothetical protein
MIGEIMKYNMNVRLILIFLMGWFVFFDVNATSGTSYSIGEHVYYDPVNGSTCNYKNYWTPFDTSGTCYRFLVIKNSSASSDTVKLMLDHNYTTDTYANYKTVLTTIKSSWTSYSGSVSILSEDDIYDLMQLSEKPVVDGGTVVGAASFDSLRENSLYYKGGTKHNSGGFWTSTLVASDNSYAYAVTENARNNVVDVTKKRGIRPVITVDKSLVTDEKAAVNITSKIKLSNKYKYLDQTFDGYTYKQMQGFTMAGDKLFFYSSNNSNSEKGLVFGYGGSGYTTSLGYYYGATGHGNDMTYNSKTGKILLVGPNSYKEIWQFDPSTFTKGSEKVYTTYDASSSNDLGLTFSGIGYNKTDNYYYAKGGINVYTTDTSFTGIMDSFSAPKTQTGQGVEFNNGYMYVTTFESGSCPSTYELYCDTSDPYSAIIYVYNAKYNSDGNPSPNFGKLVGRFYIDGGIGELETVSFDDSKMYFGFATQHFDSTYTYQIYSTDVSNVDFGPTYSISYKDGKVTISSVEDLKSISGWTLSSDKKSLTKSLSTSAETVNIFDRYSNCKEVTLKKLDSISFSDNTATYTGSKITVDSATCTSNSNITYTYYSDSSCSTKIDTPINAGKYYVKATSAGNSDYAGNSKCSALTINKGNPIISLSAKEANYTGSVVKANTATATAPNKTTSVSLSYTYTYYTDSSCSTKTKVGNGITSEGGAPVVAGQYYVKATSTATSDLNSASSSCVSHKINKVAPTITITNSVSLGITQPITVDYNYNGTGTVSCSSSDTSIATCSISNNKLNISASKIGNAVITISTTADDNYLASSDTKVNVTVFDVTTDNVKPVVSVSPNGNSKYTKGNSVVVTLQDNESGLKENQDIYYAWSTSNTESPTYTKKVTTTNSNYASKATVTIPIEDSSNLTGTYYLWIKDGVIDLNNNPSIEKVSGAFYFNNTGPEINAVVVKSQSKLKATINTSSLSKISKYEYSYDGTNYVESKSKVFTGTDIDIEKVYIRVTDELGNVSNSVAEVADESKTELNVYVVDKDNNNVLNNKINYNTKSINYKINIIVPDTDYIVDKYSKFQIEDQIDKNLTVSKETITIYNKSSEDVTDKFDIDISDDNVLTVTSNNISKDEFYGENYLVIVQTRVSDKYDYSSGDGLISNTVNLSVNDEVYKGSVESQFMYEDVTNIPNTLLNYTRIITLFGILCIVIGSIILFKIKEERV